MKTNCKNTTAWQKNETYLKKKTVKDKNTVMKYCLKIPNKVTLDLI